jgi:hypothetical protein
MDVRKYPCVLKPDQIQALADSCTAGQRHTDLVIPGCP